MILLQPQLSPAHTPSAAPVPTGPTRGPGPRTPVSFSLRSPPLRVLLIFSKSASPHTSLSAQPFPPFPHAQPLSSDCPAPMLRGLLGLE